MKRYILEFDEEMTLSEDVTEQLNRLFPNARIHDASDSGISLGCAESCDSPISLGCVECGTNLDSLVAQRVRFQTFGHFEVFVDGKPLHFGREKAKELLALLVDRHGAALTTRQIASVLWEDSEYNSKMKNKVTLTLHSLRETLRQAGVEDILIKTWNNLSINVPRIECDAYDFEVGNPGAVAAFKGEYMVNYSWAENTTGHYVQMQEKMRR